MNFDIKKTIILISAALTLVVSAPSLAAGGGNKNLDTAHINLNDKASLRNGAALFMNYCLSCHSAEYSRYNRVAEDLGIPEEAMRKNMMFTTEKFGDKMVSAMSPKDAKKWFGVTPPDLTLVSRVRKPDWVYTYLRSFYRDDKSTTGWNNSLFPNVAMPHVMAEMQGTPTLVSGPSADHDDHSHDSHDDDHSHEKDESVYMAGGATFDMSDRGSLSNEQFDTQMRDLTNFLYYLAEPAALKRVSVKERILA